MVFPARSIPWLASYTDLVGNLTFCGWGVGASRCRTNSRQVSYRYLVLTLLWRNGESHWEQDHIARDSKRGFNGAVGI